MIDITIKSEKKHLNKDIVFHTRHIRLGTNNHICYYFVPNSYYCIELGKCKFWQFNYRKGGKGQDNI